MNPMQLLQAMFNPPAMIDQFMRNPKIANNPLAQNVLNMYRNGDVQGLQQMAENISKEKGTTVEQVSNDIKRHFGFM